MSKPASGRQSPPILELDDIHKSFGDTEVLRGISFTAREGEVVALIGSSGSGKSTLLRCINMLEVPDSGIVKIAGETIALAGQPPHRRVSDEAQIRRIRSGIGMVFQQFNLWTHMSVLDNVTEAPILVQKRAATTSVPAGPRERGPGAPVPPPQK